MWVSEYSRSLQDSFHHGHVFSIHVNHWQAKTIIFDDHLIIREEGNPYLVTAPYRGFINCMFESFKKQLMKCPRIYATNVHAGSFAGVFA